MSYADAFRIDLSRTACTRPKREGDLVQLGSNNGITYEIAAIRGATAWIREPRTWRGEALVPLSRLRKVADAPGGRHRAA
ncbi:hypothetical protein [Sphingomonas lenta]|uniref:Uncharacterized protein n=1 Tax=Sphingomonas lenta TaxID=1141887 RepID=A0A2A2SC01_9SPHN|nr:hypothetical protein [Sphingomonas lenta]PAX06531.1 hypothetical protein CKY28_15360 [Sphingomonas lenta]